MPLPSLEDLARRYIAKAAPAVSGSGGHNQTFSVACALIKGFDLTVDQARPLLQEYNQRCEPPWSHSELEHKLVSADRSEDARPRGWLRLDDSEPRVAPVAPRPPPEKPIFVEDKLSRFAARWRSLVNTAWLADRSPVDPYRLSAGDFLSYLYPGEKVVVFTNDRSQGQALWPNESLPEAGPDGVLFLCQPVDGRSHPNPRNENKPSRRSEESVISWRYVVIESDEARAADWMGALVQLPLAISAIYTSGRKSIHALVRIDAPTKQEWDSIVRQMRSILITLGADPKSLSAVRLTRLPGCYRAGRLQKLLFLNPDPDCKPIVQLPRLRDVIAIHAAAALHVCMGLGDIAQKNEASNLSELIAVLESHEAQNPSASLLSRAIAALDWFKSSKEAASVWKRLALALKYPRNERLLSSMKVSSSARPLLSEVV